MIWESARRSSLGVLSRVVPFRAINYASPRLRRRPALETLTLDGKKGDFNSSVKECSSCLLSFRHRSRVLFEVPWHVSSFQWRCYGEASTSNFPAEVSRVLTSDQIEFPLAKVIELELCGTATRGETGSVLDCSGVLEKKEFQERNYQSVECDGPMQKEMPPSTPACGASGTEEERGEMPSFREGTGVFSGYRMRLAGTMSSTEALGLARRKGRQLFVLRPKASPPLCAIVDHPELLLRSLQQETVEREVRRLARKQLLEERLQKEVKEQFSFDPSVKPKALRLSTAADSADERRVLNQVRLHLQHRRRVDLQIVVPAIKNASENARTAVPMARVTRLEELLRRVVLHCMDIAKPSNLPLHAAALMQQPGQKFSLILKLCPCTAEQAATFRVGSLLAGVSPHDL